MFLIVGLLFILLLAMVLHMVYTDGDYPSIKKLLSRAVVKECWDGKERRQFVRFDKTLEVNYAVLTKPHLKNNGKTVDISEGGMKLVLGEKLPEGTVLALKLVLPDSKKTLELEGKIIWTEDAAGKEEEPRRLFNIGMKFLGMKGSCRKHFRDYIQSIALKLLR